jgi:hypothetical protein
LVPRVREHDLLRWYYLSYDGEGKVPAVEICVYEKNIPLYAEYMEAMGRKFTESEFALGFGPGYLLRNCGTRSGYEVFRVEMDVDAKIVAVTISQFLKFLRGVRNTFPIDFAGDVRRVQLMDIEVGEEDASPAGSLGIGGQISPMLTDLLEKDGKKLDFDSVNRAMWQVRSRYSEFPLPMVEDGPHRYPNAECFVKENGAFNLTVSGASCLTGGADRYTEGEGYELCRHNVDGRGLQLALFAGLAALHDTAEAHTRNTKPPS